MKTRGKTNGGDATHTVHQRSINQCPLASERMPSPEQRLTLNTKWKTDGDIGHRHRDKETLIVPLHEIDPFTYAIVDLLRETFVEGLKKKKKRKVRGILVL